MRSELRVRWRVLGDAFLRFVSVVRVLAGKDLHAYFVGGSVNSVHARNVMEFTLRSGTSSLTSEWLQTSCQSQTLTLHSDTLTKRRLYLAT